jgi:hypothetical protein
MMLSIKTITSVWKVRHVSLEGQTCQFGRSDTSVWKVRHVSLEGQTHQFGRSDIITSITALPAVPAVILVIMSILTFKAVVILYISTTVGIGVN